MLHAQQCSLTLAWKAKNDENVECGIWAEKKKLRTLPNYREQYNNNKHMSLSREIVEVFQYLVKKLFYKTMGRCTFVQKFCENNFISVY